MEKFQQIRTNPNEIFPFPENGETVLENPPSLIWIADKENNGKGYEVVLQGENGVEKKFSSKKCYCILPEPLPTGVYRWNVYSGECERGWQNFSVSENAGRSGAGTSGGLSLSKKQKGRGFRRSLRFML